MALISGNAWAEWDGTSAVYCQETQSNYSDLNDAFTKIYEASKSNDNLTTITLDLYSNVSLSNRLTLQATYSTTDESGNKTTKNFPITTISIVPKNDVTITRGTMGRNVGWFWNNKSNAAFNIGSSDKKLTIQGSGITNTSNQILNNVLRLESTGSINVTNVDFKDFWFNQETKGNTTTYGYLYNNKQVKGVLKLEDVTVTNCKTEMDAFIKSISNNDDMIIIKGHLNFESCNGTCFDTVKRIKLGDTNNAYNDFSATTPISVKWNGATNASNNGTISVIIKVASKDKDLFYLTNNKYGLVHSSVDLKLAQAHTITTSSDAKGAATLVLPFDATIPEGVTAYTLDKVGNDNVIETTKVETITADKPVLINTNENGGEYKIIATTAIAGSEATGTGTPNNGLLTGVYQETQVPSGSYILAKGKDSGLVGFYKVNTENTKKVEAYHAYMTIDSNSSDSAKPSFFRVIGGGDGGTTLIKGVETNEEKAQEGVYNLNGVRMDKPERKGIYIVNGKKRIVK